LSEKERIPRLKTISRDAYLLAAFIAIIAIVIAVYIFAWLPGAITKVDLVNFIAAVVTVTSLVMTLCLAILAVNTFSYGSQLQKLREDALDLQSELEERALSADRMLELFPVVIESIIGEMRKSPVDESGPDRDYAYYRLLHVRLFLRLLIVSDNKMKIDVCRDIIGSMQSGDSRDLLEQTLDILHQLQNDMPEDRDLIDPLIREGLSRLAQMPFERHLDHGKNFRSRNRGQVDVPTRRFGFPNIFRFK